VSRATPFVHLFETESCKYAYDVNTMRVVRLNEASDALLRHWGQNEEELSRALGGRFSRDELALAKRRIEGASSRDEVFSTRRPAEVRRPETRDAVQRCLSTDCQQLILCASEQCNMRCAYCVYGGGRPPRRGHSPRKMSWDIAKRAIEFYRERCGRTLERYRQSKRELGSSEARRGNEPKVPPCVSFYGGEPLLNLALVKRSLEYARALPEGEDYMLRMTTNGTLLSPSVAEFLVQHSVGISVSLDGPREVHDRYRRFVDGSGTFDVITRNLRHIRAHHPEYYDRHVGVLAVLSPPVDWERLLDFYLHFDLLPPMGTFNALDSDCPPTFLEALSPEDLVPRGEDELWEEFVKFALEGRMNAEYQPRTKSERSKISFLRKVFDSTVIHMYSRTRHACERQASVPSVLPISCGMCVPGQLRTYVDVDGNFFPCERVPEGSIDLRIGDLDRGYDIDAIMRLMHESVAMTADVCINCWNVRTCTIPCAQIVGPDGRLSRESKLRACEQARRRSHYALVSMCRILEKDGKALSYLDGVLP